VICINARTFGGAQVGILRVGTGWLVSSAANAVRKHRPKLNKLSSGWDWAASEEEVPLVGFAFRSAVSSEAHLFGIVGAEFVTKELPVWRTPRLRLSVNDR
jgi:hypothetical protein